MALIVSGLEGYSQTDEPTTKQFRFKSDFSSIEPLAIDTSFFLFNRVRIADKFSPLNAYPGNYGLPFYQINFFDRVTDPDYYLYQNYFPLMRIPSNAIFMDTRVPFTELSYSNAGPKLTAEQIFRFRESLNINRYLNLGLVFDITYSLGQYPYQKAMNKDFLLHSSYVRERFETYLALGINRIATNENGGITDPELLPELDTRDLPVNLGGLNNAKSTLKNWNFLLVQKYYPIKSGSGTDSIPRSGVKGDFTYIFAAEGNKRHYYDESPRSGFYDTAYYNNDLTNDSLRSFLLKNTLRFDFTFRSKGGFQIGAGVGGRHELHKYEQFVPPVIPLLPYLVNMSDQNFALIGRLDSRVGQNFGLEATGDLYIAGHRAGDFKIAGDITRDFNMKKGKSEFSLNGSFSLTEPSVWFARWGSNNFKWDIDTEKELRIVAGALISYPERKLSADFKYSIIDNYGYFGTDALPAQHTGGLSVLAATLDKTITVGGFNLGNIFLFQQSSNTEVLSLPSFSLKSALWFYRDIYFKLTGGRMEIETGAEVLFHTQYRGYAYMPATGRFYNQTATYQGGYPFVNVFFNAKIKRTRITLSFDHVNSGMNGENYYLTPLNPMNNRMFRFGFSWTFYD